MQHMYQCLVPSQSGAQWRVCGGCSASLPLKKNRWKRSRFAELAGRGKSVRTLLATWAGRDADDPMVLEPFVPPKIERQLGTSRNPRETLHELQIGSDLLEPSELDVELAGRGRARRCVGHQDAGPCPMHLPRLRDANIPQRQRRFAELGGNRLRRAEQHKSNHQQNRSMRET